MRNVILEGRKESEALLVKAFPEDQRLRQTLIDLDQSPSKGDVPVIIKFYRENGDLDLIQSYLQRYYDFKGRNILVKSPSAFTSFIKWTEAIDAEDAKQQLKLRPKTSTATPEDDSANPDMVADDEFCTIYLADTEAKCVKYGASYPYCISRPSGGNMFNSYRIGKHSTFYFIFFKGVPRKDLNHMMVLDVTKDGLEWTFEDNHTANTDWDDVLEKFPMLGPHRNLLVNKPLTPKEEQNLKDTKELMQTPSLERFLQADPEVQHTYLKSGSNLPNEIFTHLQKNNAWDLINEFVSTGPNLTPLQASALKQKGGAILKQYLKHREIVLEQRIKADRYTLNELDQQIPLVQQKIENAYQQAYNIVEKAIGESERPGACKIHIQGNRFLTRLPDNIPETVKFFNLTQTSVTSLKGAPRFVEQYFLIGRNKLTSLEGGPESVGDKFDCYHNQLTSLKGGPSEVGGNYLCSDNQLTSLEGCPERIYGVFNCHDNRLRTLEGGPSQVDSVYACSMNILTSLKGAPKHIGANFDCSNNQLTTLEGGPESLGTTYDCNYNKLTSLKGAPDIVKDDFICHHNQLTNLKGGPSKIYMDYDCSENKLASLKGSPPEIENNFDCSGNMLTSLEGGPLCVHGEFNIRNNGLMKLKGFPFLTGRNYKINGNPRSFTGTEIESAIEAARERWEKFQQEDDDQIEVSIKKQFGESFKQFFTKYYRS